MKLKFKIESSLKPNKIKDVFLLILGTFFSQFLHLLTMTSLSDTMQQLYLPTIQGG